VWQNPTAVNLSFLDQSSYFFFQVAPHLSIHPLLLRKSGSAENRTQDLWVCSQEQPQHCQCVRWYILRISHTEYENFLWHIHHYKRVPSAVTSCYNFLQELWLQIFLPKLF
jgi:hypothetical protein